MTQEESEVELERVCFQACTTVVTHVLQEIMWPEKKTFAVEFKWNKYTAQNQALRAKWYD